jgi:hypothetical protein
MKPRNLGHVRARQRKHLKKFYNTPLQHRPRAEGETTCFESFSHADVGFGFMEEHPVRAYKGRPCPPEILRVEPTGPILCPHCGAEVAWQLTLFGDNFWATVPTEE